MEYCLPVPRHSVAITLRYLPSEKRRSVSSINTFTDGRHNIRSRTILAKTGHLQYKSSEILNSVYNIHNRIYRVSILTSTLSTVDLSLRQPASAVIFHDISSAQGNSKREALCIKYNVILSDYQQTQLEPIINTKMKLRHKNGNYCYMVTSTNRTEQKICFIFITVSLHNSRHKSVDIMTRLDEQEIVGVFFPGCGRDLLLGRSSFISVGKLVICFEINNPRVKLTAYFHIVPRLGMLGVIPPLSTHHRMVLN